MLRNVAAFHRKLVKNYGDRIGYTMSLYENKPFWWVSPSGQDRVLFWMAGRGYSWFHGMNMGQAGAAGKQPFLDYLGRPGAIEILLLLYKPNYTWPGLIIVLLVLIIPETDTAGISIVRLEGTILTGDACTEDVSGSECIGEDLRDAADDALVKAIVLRVNSPGGTPAGAQEIIRDLRRPAVPSEPISAPAWKARPSAPTCPRRTSDRS
jgi:hypothetical protein